MSVPFNAPFFASTAQLDSPPLALQGGLGPLGPHPGPGLGPLGLDMLEQQQQQQQQHKGLQGQHGMGMAEHTRDYNANASGAQRAPPPKRKATGRTCLECGATTTPQWREGPQGTVPHRMMPN